MQVDTIHLFCDVAQLHSVSKGAALHGVTQSAASQRIRALEEDLGVQLIDRSHRPLQLTDAGQLYHRGCRKILDDYEKLTRQMTGCRDRSGPLKGEVTVAAIYSAGINLLNQLSREFETRHPGAQVVINFLQPDAVYEQVRGQHCDLGILSYPQRWRGLKSVPLRNETMVVVGRAGHPLASRGVVRAEELSGQAMVSFDRTLPIGQGIHRYLVENHARADRANSFDNIDTIKTFVAQTDAVAILPDRTVRREVEAGILVSAALEPALQRPVAVVYSAAGQLGELATAFLQHLVGSEPAEGDTRPVVETVASASGSGVVA